MLPTDPHQWIGVLVDILDQGLDNLIAQLKNLVVRVHNLLVST